MAKKSLFQKIMDGLFDEVVIEEEVNEPIKTEEVKLPPVSSVIKEKKVEESKAEEVQKEVIKKETRSTMISVDDLKEPEKVKKVAPMERKQKTEYEFTKVISPIFGVIKENSTDEKEEKPTLNTKKTTTTIKNKSVLGTVISPIYGIAKEEIVEEKESVEEVEELSLDDLIEKNESNEESIHDADFESLVASLEEKANKVEKEEECQNLSLFDDFDDFVKF